VQAIANGAIAVADRVEGFVETSTVDVGPGQATATLSLRIPTHRADDALAALSAWPTCASAQQATDLPESLDSTQERLEEARDRVRSLGGELASLEERTSLATIELEDLLRGAGVAVVALAAAVPLAVVLGLAVLGVGLSRRRIRERALDAVA